MKRKKVKKRIEVKVEVEVEEVAYKMKCVC